MNRQALAFLTMFSLILMLSVYYVTLPSDTTSVMSTENGEDLSDKQEQNEDEHVNDAQTLQQEITSKKEEEIKKNSDIVSSTESNETQKQEALETIDVLKSDQATSEEVKKALQDAGFNAAVEIGEGTCKISVFESDDNEENAKAIMKIANEKTENKYLIEVTFK